MKKSSFLVLSVLVFSLAVSVGSVQAKPMGKPFVYQVNMAKTGWATSSLPWLREWNAGPIGWWGGGPPFPAEEDWMNNVYYCHGDWNMSCATHSGNFRYQWWIYWSDNPNENPTARNLGGEFTFSEGTGDFTGMSASGKAWVASIRSPIQHHIGTISGAPE